MKKENREAQAILEAKAKLARNPLCPAMICEAEPLREEKLCNTAKRNALLAEYLGNDDGVHIYKFTLTPKKGRPRIGTRVTITLPDHTLAHVRAVAEKTGCPVAEVIRQYCEAMQSTAWSRTNGR